MKLQHLVEMGYSDDNANFVAWRKAVRMHHPNATFVGNSRQAQAVDWTSKANEVAGDWMGLKGVVYKPGSLGKETIEVVESISSAITISTETGTATFDPATGEMTLDNSGYDRHLSKEQVAAAWSGAPTIPYTKEDINDIAMDLQGQELAAEIQRGVAQFRDDMGLWDFGEELHEIPPKAAFAKRRR